MAKFIHLEDSTVKLKVTGPFSIFKGQTCVGKAKLDQTWLDFLVNTCQLSITGQDGLYILTKTTSTSGGWTAKLNEKILELVKKYKGRMDQYSVELISSTQATKEKVREQASAPGDIVRVSIGEEGDAGRNLGKKQRKRSALCVGNEETLGDAEEQQRKMEDATGNDAKTILLQTIERFGSNCILELRQEIEDAKRRNLWSMLAKATPLSCYLLEELSKI